MGLLIHFLTPPPGLTAGRTQEMKNMTINKIRSLLYPLAKYLGDLQAILSKRKGAVGRRVGRRVAGHITGKHILGGLFK